MSTTIISRRQEDNALANMVAGRSVLQYSISYIIVHQTIVLNRYIDLESRSGASTLETQVCYNYAPEATVSYVATKGGRVTTYDPRWLLRVN